MASWKFSIQCDKQGIYMVMISHQVCTITKNNVKGNWISTRDRTNYKYDRRKNLFTLHIWFSIGKTAELVQFWCEPMCPVNVNQTFSFSASQVPSKIRKTVEFMRPYCYPRVFWGGLQRVSFLQWCGLWPPVDGTIPIHIGTTLFILDGDKTRRKRKRKKKREGKHE